jgi:hypothetical protein
MEYGPAGFLGSRSEGGDDRCSLLQAEPHGDALGVKKWGPSDQRRLLVGQSKGFRNAKLHVVGDAHSHLIQYFTSARYVSDSSGAAALLSNLSKTEWLIADRGNDAECFWEALGGNGICPRIPGRKSRDKAARYDKQRY